MSFKYYLPVFAIQLHHIYASFNFMFVDVAYNKVYQVLQKYNMYITSLINHEDIVITPLINHAAIA